MGVTQSFLQALQKYKKPLALLAGVAFLLAAVLQLIVFPQICEDVKEIRHKEGTQGFRVWFSDKLWTFEHKGRNICIPEGWRAVGAEEINEEEGWARFERNLTGILIHEDSFAEREVTVPESPYVVTLLYPTSVETIAEDYERIVKNTFSNVGALFPNNTETKKHTVLVTIGVEETLPQEESVYPDPRESMTIFFSHPNSFRGEELFIHAVMHLHNRFREDLTAYQNNQNPLFPEDFQELEATWAESAFRSSSEGRLLRANYMYNVHTAVQNKNFTLIEGPPFDNERAFESIEPNVIAEEGTSHVNIQYGHYILAPLAMVAIDGLLQEYGAAADVEIILTRIHANDTVNFFDELRRYIPESELQNIDGWMFGGETVPFSLIQRALQYYETRR